MKLIKNNILEAIGNTPMVKINHLCPNPNVLIAAKLEGTNPGGSIKDRPALFMIEMAEKSGELTKDKIIIEPTSGNTGIGLAMVAAVKGYKLIVTMSEWMSMERRKTLSAFGAEIILTPGEEGTDGAIEKAQELYESNPNLYFMPNQFANQNNYLAHYEKTTTEIWEQTEGKITHFVAGMGTTGTLMGVSQRLKELNPDIHIIGVEPNMRHKVQGLKNMEEAKVPDIYDIKRLDRKVRINDDDAFDMSRLLARKEGIFSGISAGAAMHVAVETAKEIDKGVIVVIIPDRGDKYLSTDLFCFNPCGNTNCTIKGE
ncbi:PLP-dependent cysteine synthase family protein [Phosphitispora sp. TUW77]|uniref:PLP-dependent cysteine synthase family protein n=1 Tax=Phosphitispora sp. TUW77 TaxID=3152361 RepID=UPI003AB3E60A